MTSGFVIRKSQYYDSVFLMRIAKTLNDEPGVTQSAVLMATDVNKDLLADIGITGAAITSATPNDLVVAVISNDPTLVERLLASIDERLQAVTSTKKVTNYRSVDEASLANPDSNLVIISVPGQYASREARKALEQDKHVFLFSDNVPLDQEVELKQLAKERGRLLMGPDCGTCLISGVGIGFANKVRRGPIGVVGASGTGIQEFTSLVHQAGSGISHAIGTGSHDLADAVRGITSLMGLDALEVDPATRVIAIISKPAGPETLLHLLARIRTITKPVVACFLGLDHALVGIGGHFHQGKTIDEAVRLALQVGQVDDNTNFADYPSSMQTTIQHEVAGWCKEQRYLRGLFAGGTFCYQTQQVLREAGLATYSNAPLDKRHRLENPETSLENTVIDLGDDYFTRGKPHPMIDASQRRKRILVEAADANVAVILLDFILGTISSADPVGDLVGALQEAQAVVDRRGGHLTVVASICGTDQDPQGMDHQRKLLEDLGALVFPSNYQASRFCADLLITANEREHGN
jgi:FdrA protein